jgi:hypothetical protein
MISFIGFEILFPCYYTSINLLIKSLQKSNVLRIALGALGIALGALGIALGALGISVDHNRDQRREN